MALKRVIQLRLATAISLIVHAHLLLDVAALNSLCISLEPVLWNASGGDPSGTDLHLNRSISGLQRVLIFDVSSNNIQGNMPYQLPPFVRQMNLGGNATTAKIPFSLQELTNLTDLNLSHNKLQNGVPDVWTKLKSLRVLIGGNNFSNAPPRSLLQQRPWR